MRERGEKPDKPGAGYFSGGSPRRPHPAENPAYALEWHLDQTHESYMHDDLLAFPMIGWEITTLSSEGIVCVRLPYLPLEHDSLAEALSGRPHAMSIEQAREFRDALTRSIQRIDDHPPRPHLAEKPASHREQIQQRRNAERRKRDRRQQVSR
jgi:hypothetical protein